MPPCASKLRNKTGGKTVCWGVGDPEFQLCSVWIIHNFAKSAWILEIFGPRYIRMTC